jgi:hypothetical protein
MINIWLQGERTEAGRPFTRLVRCVDEGVVPDPAFRNGLMAKFWALAYHWQFTDVNWEAPAYVVRTSDGIIYY